MGAVTGFEGAEDELLSLCTLRVDGTLYGIDTRRIREVLGRAAVQQVPLAPDFIAGVVSYRGDVITTVSLRVLLGLAGAPSGHVLVVDGGESVRFGLLVDAVGGVVNVRRAGLEANPTTLDELHKTLLRGSYWMGEALLVELDPDQLQPEGGAAHKLRQAGEESRCGP